MQGAEDFSCKKMSPAPCTPTLKKNFENNGERLVFNYFVMSPSVQWIT